MVSRIASLRPPLDRAFEQRPGLSAPREIRIRSIVRDPVLNLASYNYYRYLNLDVLGLPAGTPHFEQVSVVQGLEFGAENRRTLSPCALRLIMIATNIPRVHCTGLMPWQIEIYRLSGGLHVVQTPEGQEAIEINHGHVPRCDTILQCDGVRARLQAEAFNFGYVSM